MKNFLIPPHLLTNTEIREYYQNEPRFNGIYSRDNLPKKNKDGAYVINLDEYGGTGITNQQAEMINSTYKSNDDVYSRVDTLKSDSNLNTLPFPNSNI